MDARCNLAAIKQHHNYIYKMDLKDLYTLTPGLMCHQRTDLIYGFTLECGLGSKFE